ncbi:MAG: class I SAM-dependent methyltransferase [Bacteroidetes bacterium]|nr:class I SAM-dependent methyltransferase [Bacteroidota bacterium]
MTGSSSNIIPDQNFPEVLPIEYGVFMGMKNPLSSSFESDYLKVRAAEQRLYSDEYVVALPELKNHVHQHEWKMRNRSANRVLSYFQNTHSGRLLDLGCGNGWFSQALAKKSRLQVIGMDVNLTELKQAARLFQRSNLQFVYADIFNADIPPGFFDVITLNASVQYFPDLSLLLKKLFLILKPKGEIHIIDTPFYHVTELEEARKRTRDYYAGIGYPEMATHYFHHSYDALKHFKYDFLYKPETRSRILRYFGKAEIPFPWIKIAGTV